METKKLHEKELFQLIQSIFNREVVAFPTDTVYGIACSPKYEDAIEKMKWVKGRDGEKPFPMMVSSKEQIAEIAEITPVSIPVIDHFLPGAITIVLKKKSTISDHVTCGKQTIAIRMPDDELVLSILQATGPLLVTSANLSGMPTGHTSEEVLQQLDGRISHILIGESGQASASTIVDCSNNELKILREGPITLEELKKAHLELSM